MEPCNSKRAPTSQSQNSHGAWRSNRSSNLRAIHHPPQCRRIFHRGRARSVRHYTPYRKHSPCRKGIYDVRRASRYQSRLGGNSQSTKVVGEDLHNRTRRRLHGSRNGTAGRHHPCLLGSRYHSLERLHAYQVYHHSILPLLLPAPLQNNSRILVLMHVYPR